MAIEIERKFLVDLGRLGGLTAGEVISQGYIPTQDKTAVRVRTKGDSAFLTLKGENRGAARLEFEYEIPVTDAQVILAQLCSGPRIEKVRYTMNFGNHLWEIDVFHGENLGLVVAEVELTHEDEDLSLPPWVNEEVTGDSRYYNVNLLTHPYLRW